MLATKSLSAIIGATGFVGSNLRTSHNFNDTFNSQNIAEISGKIYDLAICAAAPATMWAANKDPEGDLENIRRLIANLQGVKADRFVLISTIAVLEDASAGLDETTPRFEKNKAYGRHRRLLEEACSNIFHNVHILRLPALFGTGLKKNFIFDILHPMPSFIAQQKFAELSDDLPKSVVPLLKSAYRLDDELGMYQCDRSILTKESHDELLAALRDADFTALVFTNPDSTYQYYGLHRLWDDIGHIIAEGWPLVHLAPQPLTARDVYRALTGHDLKPSNAVVYHEDMRTLHAKSWGGPDGYVSSKQDVIADLKTFYNAMRPT